MHVGSETRVGVGKFGPLGDDKGNQDFAGVIQARHEPRHQGQRDGSSHRLPTRLGHFTCVAPREHPLCGHTVPDVHEASEAVTRMEMNRAVRSSSATTDPAVFSGVSPAMATTAREMAAGDEVRPGELVAP